DALAGTAQPGPEGGLPIWYMEDGFQTRTGTRRLAAYSGVENDTGAVSEAAQARQLVAAIRLAYCQPYVRAFFNFELTDEHRLAGWQSGVFRADGSRKPAYASLRRTIREVAKGRVSCAEFGPAATGEPLVSRAPTQPGA